MIKNKTKEWLILPKEDGSQMETQMSRCN